MNYPGLPSRQKLICRTHLTRRRHRRLSPLLEALEGRVVLSTLTVTSAADNGTGTLRALIAAASGGDTIVFAPSLDNDKIALTSGELAIGESLTIKGPGASLLDVDAGGSSRVFDITSSAAIVTISGLKIGGGEAANGGGIFDQGGALTLKNDTLSNDQAIGVNPGDTAQGGGVDVTDSGSLTVSGGTFQYDDAQGAAGASGGNDVINGQGGDGSGGAIFADTGTNLSVTGTTFLQNDAIGGFGGDGGTGILNGFGGNANGGAIYAFSNSLSVTNSSFTKDLSQGGAGGLGQGGTSSANGFGGNVNGTIDLDTLNAAATFIFSGDTFTQEQALGGAGASAVAPGFGGVGGSVSGVININDIEPALSIQNCAFSANLAQGGAGGSGLAAPGGEGGTVVGDAVYTAGNLLVSSSSFIGNQAIGGAGGSGGAGSEGGPGGIISGSAFAAFGNVTTVSGSTIIGNQAIGGAGGNGGDGGDGSPGGPVAGGALYVFAGLTLTGSVLIGNEAIGGAGGAGGNGGTGGAAGIAEGAAIFGQGEPTTFPSNPPFSPSDITSCIFIGNEALGGTGGSGGQGGAGGAAESAREVMRSWRGLSPSIPAA